MPQLDPEWHESLPVRDKLTGVTYHWDRSQPLFAAQAYTSMHMHA